jgi:muconolactone D-isomerase
VLFHITMDVNIPHDLDPDVRADLLRREGEYSGGLQRSGAWKELWRVVGRYSNISIIEADSNDHLHEILSGLPLYPYMDIRVTALARHPNRID